MNSKNNQNQKNIKMTINLAVRQFLIYFKSFFKKPAFLLLFILMVLITILFRTYETESQTGTVIAYYITEESSDEAEIIRKCIESYEGYFKFSEATDEAQVLYSVSTGQAHTGYIIPSDLFIRIENGDKNQLIKSVKSSSSTFSYVTDEILYSLLFAEISKNDITSYLYYDQLKQNNSETSGITLNNMKDTFEMYREAMKITVEYIPISALDHSVSAINKDTSGFEDTSSPHVLTSFIRGLFALFINIAAVFGVLDYYSNKKTYIRYSSRFLVFSIVIPVLFTSLATLTCVILAGVFTSFIKEVLALILYIAALTIINFILCKIIKGPAVFYALLPFYILACLLFTPVFFNIYNYIENIKPLSFIFLPNIYMTWF